MMVATGHAVLGDRCDTTGGTNSQIRSIVDEAADLDKIKEDGRIDGPRPWGIIVQVGQSLEDLRRELKPWAVKGRDIAPMPDEYQGQKVSLRFK